MKSLIYKKNGTGKLQHDAGAMAVEFALVAPIFFLILFATIELGIYLHDRQVLSNAAREAARVGIVMQSPRTIPTVTPVIQQTALNFSTTLIGVNLTCAPGGTCPEIVVATPQGLLPGRPLTVTIITPFPFPFLSALGNLAPTISVGGISTMILE